MCTNPRYIKRPDGTSMMVGCGHCLQCLKAYQDSWTARLNEELKSWTPVVQNGVKSLPVIFFTLDYNPEAIPCTYLVVTDIGVRLQKEKPDCPVYRFWTDTTHETHEEWLMRRRDMLRIYHQYNKLRWSLQDRRATADDIRAGNYVDRSRCCLVSRCYFDTDLPDFDIHFQRFDSGVLDHPVIDYDVLRDHTGAGDPIVAFEFHTVSKSDVQDWNKRGRIRLVRRYPEVFDQSVNPRFLPFWKGLDGVDHELPTCALPKTTKFFITSEYGPLTYRPHYHGVVFGMTYDEFKECFAEDWEANFGHCRFSLLRSSGGAITYLSKYCSKGSYEHPYCCKDIIYPSGEEFHSRSYFNSKTDFGVDMAMVTPTFHLISKGVGAAYAFNSEIQQYFGSKLSEYLTESGRVKYVASDGDRLGCTRPSVKLSELLCLFEGNSLSKTIDVNCRENGDIVVRKFDNNGRLSGESLIPASAVINTAVEDYLNSTLYHRTYVKQTYKGKPVPGRCLPCWHLIGLDRLSHPQTVTTSVALPRYYRQWLVSPLASLLRQSAAKRLYPSLNETVTRMLEQGRSYDEITAYVKQVMDYDSFRHTNATLRLSRSAANFYHPFGFKNLE